MVNVKRIIRVKVKPGSKEEKIEEVDDANYIISLKEDAEANKANKRLINLLSKRFGVDFRRIKIKNPKSRDKVIEIG